MSVSVTVAGTSYTIPSVGDVSWGPQVTAWIQAISAVTLQTSGGNFTLTSDLNFGTSFGVLSKYFTSVSANAAGTGVLRLANTDGIGFRNSGNSADILLKPDADGFLQYGGIDLVNLSGTQTLTNKTLTSPVITTPTGIVKGDVGLGNVDNTSDATKNSATATLTNKTIAAGSNTISGLINSNLSGTAAITNANLATMVNLTLKGNISGSTTTPSDVTLTSAATASTVMFRDTNSNTATNNNIEGFATTATAASTTTLTVASKAIQQFTGSTTQTIVLPDATTLALGFQFQITNRSSGTVTVNANGGGLVQTMLASTQCTFTCTSIGTSAGTWDAAYTTAGNALVTPMTTGGDIIYGGTSGVATRLANGTAGQVLTSSGTTVAPTWTSLRTFIPISIQSFVTGTGNYNLNYTFIVTSANATAGATYTDSNSHTFTVSTTISGQAQLVASGSVAPATSGTLTKTGGTGDSTITYSTFATPIYLKVTTVAGGGGGGGSGTGAGTASGSGGNTTFGSSMLTCAGGGGGGLGSAGGGGTASLAGAVGLSFSGAAGQAVVNNVSGGILIPGGAGASSPFGGAGAGVINATGGAAQALTGSGGAGGGLATVANSFTGGGGGAGAYIIAYITSPLSTYAYAVGSGGGAGGAGASGHAGGAGAGGNILVEEHYQ